MFTFNVLSFETYQHLISKTVLIFLWPQITKLKKTSNRDYILLKNWLRMRRKLSTKTWILFSTRTRKLKNKATGIIFYTKVSHELGKKFRNKDFMKISQQYGTLCCQTRHFQISDATKIRQYKIAPCENARQP